MNPPPPLHTVDSIGPAKKSSPWPWIIGGCGCLTVIVLVLAGVAGYWFYTKATEPPRVYSTYRDEPSPVKDTTSPSSPIVPSGWTTYVNNKDTLPPVFQENFVGFSFSYPADKFAVSSDTSNFIKVENNLHDATQGDFTVASFAVGSMFGPLGLTSQEDQDSIYPEVLKQLGEQTAKSFPNYKEIAQITDYVGGERGRSLLFQAEFKGTPKGDIKFYGKILAVRHPGKAKGVALIMLATSLDPSITSPADVATKGDLASILASFKFAD